jgi:hypothetical protein
MKTLRTSTGPFAERPYYPDADIERICTDALAEIGYLPKEPGPVRIDRFVEKRFNTRIIYESLPVNVLGFTEFGPNGVVAVHIAEPPAHQRTRAAERRMNATIAHEGGHGLMHAHLFALALDRGKLFENDPDVTDTRVLCRDGDRATPAPRQRRYDGRWWEVQANRAIGALLLPKSLFVSFMESFLEPQGSLDLPTLTVARRAEAIQAVADLFDVNQAVAKLRIASIFPEQGGQLTL